MDNTALTADEYIRTHWIPKNINNNLSRPKHQVRFKTLGGYLKGDTCVDVGCAQGRSTYFLSKVYGAKWTGLDFWEGLLESRKDPDMAGIDFQYCEFFDEMAVGGQWDSVVCSEVLEHVEDDKGLVKGLLNSARRVVVLTTPNKHITDPGHLRVYTKDMLRRLFSHPDFSVEINSQGDFWYVIARRNQERLVTHG